MQGLILWWSTFYQQWNWTPWEEMELLGKGETTTYKGKPILSDEQLLKTLTKEAHRRFHGAEGVAHVIESAYYAIWCSDDEYKDFLAKQQEWLVCHEV